MLLRIARISYDPVVAYASEELKRCLEKMDPSLEIILLTYPKWREDIKNALWVGMDDAVSAELPEVADKKLDDAIAIDVKGGVGYITGTNPRAVLIAAFRYLRELGAMWVRPKDGEYLPACTVTDRVVKIAEAPSSRHRGVCIEGAVSVDHVRDMIDWMPRVGLNAYFNQFWVPATFYDRWYIPHLSKKMQNEEITRADVEGIRDASIYEIKRRGLLYHATGHGWTCEPFGIEGMDWDGSKERHVPEEAVQYLALTKGKRQLWNNVPLNTNLCYSNPKVREIVSNSIADYCEANNMVDYLHVWLADDRNNHCECENCTKKTPSDWYVILLNKIDETLTARGIGTKVVFLIYNELLWAPVEGKLNNPDRFVLMFAPISRTYTNSLADVGDYDLNDLPAYEYNNMKSPRSVEENIGFLRKWQDFFKGDSFDYDYHYMWDHHKDPAHMSMNKVLFNDMKAMRKLGIGGMVSCQNQRVWLPTGFGMVAMASALWNNEADYDKVANNYFAAAFGPEGILARTYLEKLSDLFTPPYMRGEMGVVCAEAAEKAAQIPACVNAFAEIIERNLNGSLPEVQRRSWEYLDYHKNYSILLGAAVQKRAEGKQEEAKRCWSIFEKYIMDNEEKYPDVLDVAVLRGTLGGMFR
ncbi:MAG: DUF4838 domain-containing protein [Oscillospiraceae bacterium]|nr:DUF4838 domain-containing protein [Oscillospiraceae bacterium]